MIVVTGCGGNSMGSSTSSGSSGSGSGTGTSGSSSSTPAPTITAINPISINAGSSNLTLTVNGTGFTSTSIIQVNNTKETTTYKSSTQLTATVPASQIASGAEMPVFVLNGTTSSAATPIDLEVDNPAPVIQSISPTSEAEGATSTTVTVTGTGFVPTTTIYVNGASRATTYTSATKVSFTLTSADVTATGSLSLTAVNSAPGGGTSAAAKLDILAPPTTPVITSITPNSIVAGSPDTLIVVAGSNFTSNSVIQWNGTALKTSFSYSYPGPVLTATLTQADLAAAGTNTITVNTPDASPSLSNKETVTITQPPVPTATYLAPNNGPIHQGASVTLTGTGFTTQTTVEFNGKPIPTTYVSDTQVKTDLSASDLAFPGDYNLSVMTPGPGGGSSSSLAYTTYIFLPNNDMVYNPVDGLLWVSVPADSVGDQGNSVDGIDPVTGNIERRIQVGSDPNKLALSSDGTQLFVGIDGSGTVLQVDLTTGKVVDQFALGGGSGIYNTPHTAQYLAAVPGSPNSVAVSLPGAFPSYGGVTIFDSGVARTNSSSNVGEGPLSFGSSASTLYMEGSGVQQLSVDSTGITAANTLYTSKRVVSDLQYDKGMIYLSSGEVLNASTGALAGTFYSSATTPANGPIVSDSTLGKAFIAVSSFNSRGSILVFDENSFNLLGSIPVNGEGIGGYPSSFNRIVRWGQNGVAVSTSPTLNNTPSQIFIFHSPLVKDVSSSPADLSVTFKAPTSTTTGSTSSWTATISNAGPDPASGVTLSIDLDPSLIIHSVTPDQGSCGSGTSFTCDLGSIASGANVTVTVSATPTTSGTLTASTNVGSTSYDPKPSNNQANATTTVTGSLYSAVPAISSISPNLVQAGSSDFTLTVNGSGFDQNSTVNLNTTALTTTYVSSSQITAQVTASQIANYGWAAVTVSNSTPGGGVSQILPLTIYDSINIPASGLLFDPYTQFLYATLPSTATGITGNSVVTINPYTGKLGTPVSVGSEPTVMAESSDGNYLYISLTGASSLAQYDLLNQKLAATISLGTASGAPSSSATATGLSVMPGNDTTLAVDMNQTDGILDISGNTGTFRSNFANANVPTFADATHLYTYDNETTGAQFYRYSIDSTGASQIDATSLDGLGGNGINFQLVNGIVYGPGGGIINPTTTPPSQITTLPTLSNYPTTQGLAVAADPSLQKEFMVLDSFSGSSSSAIIRYDLNSYLPEADLNLPQSFSGFDRQWDVARFGQDGLALLPLDPYNTSTTSPAIVLIRGPFVAPQELQTETAATLTSSSASTITHGGGNTILTLTGSNFLPGVAVTWNGHYRTTNVVDSTHVTVDIPASDLAAAGTVTLVATNPGAPASNTLQITIQ